MNKNLSVIFEELVKEHGDKLADDVSRNTTLVGPVPLPVITIDQESGFVVTGGYLLSPLAFGKSFAGVVAAGIPPTGYSKSYYPNGFSGQHGIPECSSRDGKTPNSSNPVSPSCKGCQHNQWGSGPSGIGTACRNGKTLLVYINDNNGSDLLVRFRISGKSIAALSEYMIEFARNNIAVWKVATEFTIESTGKYQSVNFDFLEILPDNELELMKKLIESSELMDAIQK